MAKICLQRKQEAKAIILLNTALSINPDFIEAHKILLQIYETTQDFDGMLNQTLILHKLSPENPSYNLRLATLYLQQKKLELSEKYFKKAISISPALAAAYKGIGDVAMLQKEFKKAEKAYKKCLDLEQNDISVLNSLGMAYVRMQKFQEGIQCYVMALKIDAKNEKIIFNLGHTWEKIGQTEEAIAKYKLALKINPTYGKAQRGLSRVQTSESDKGSPSTS
jgi:tetratricopeptide (TPR) repeat protein